MKCRSMTPWSVAGLGIVGLALLWPATAAIADVNVLYTDPSGGWAYSYVGEGDAFNEPDYFSHLDGTWDSFNGLEQWDGSKVGEIGVPLEEGGGEAPGGVLAVDDSAGDGTKYLRVQDTGKPHDPAYGWEHQEGFNTNAKFNFVHDISEMGRTNLEILDVGVTLSFRARIATQAADIDAALDPAYPAGGGGPQTWPAGGDGAPISYMGQGMFGVSQSAPYVEPFFYNGTIYEDPSGKQIGFSLATHSDLEAAGAGHLTSGLVMNNLAGDTPSFGSDGGVDTNGSSNNIVTVSDADLTEWREFWITIEENDSTPGNGTHTVNVYQDGSLTPIPFDVTAAMGISSMRNYGYAGGHLSTFLDADFDSDDDVDGEDFLAWQRGFGTTYTADDLTLWRVEFGRLLALDDISYLQMAQSLLLGSAVDIDFYSYKPGVHTPSSSAAATAVPEPASGSLLGGILLLVGSVGGIVRRRRRGAGA